MVNTRPLLTVSLSPDGSIGLCYEGNGTSGWMDRWMDG